MSDAGSHPSAHADDGDQTATEPGSKKSAARATDHPAEKKETRAHHGNGHAHKKNGADKKSQRAGPPLYQRPLVVAGVFLGVLVLAIGGTLWWLHARDYESTDDAIIDVIPQMVSAQLPGRVLRVDVQDNQDVAAETVLVELDPADYEARAEQARAAGAQAGAQGDQARAQRGIYEAQRDQAQASLTVARTSADNAAKELGRLDAVRQENAGAVSQQQHDNADAAQKSTAAQVQAAQKSVAAAEAQVHYAGSLLQAAEAAQASAAAQLKEAEYNLSYMQIRAKLAGRVANLHVAPGNYVQPGSALMAIVPREVYVTANFKETQLAHMRRGQPVKVKVDAYPDLELAGHIDSFQPGTGQTFSSLPAENATGNWVKVVQRTAVKITLDRLPDDADQRLGPGMSVEVKVTVR